jgi:AraC-like DNA-binding protein
MHDMMLKNLCQLFREGRLSMNRELLSK